MVTKPAVVCLCGSTRFVETFNEWRKKLTYEGKIVLAIEIVTIQAKKDYPSSETKKMLDELYLRMIDMADEVMILNVGGYIGESTKKELEYARKNSKSIKFLETTNIPDNL